MFKIGKLEYVKNEKIKIDVTNTMQNTYKDKEIISSEPFVFLSFDITGDDYSFYFQLGCKLKELLDMPKNEIHDFNQYVIGGESLLKIPYYDGTEPEISVQVIRYLKNKFMILARFYTEYSNDYNDYSGRIEFTFNLDDYMGDLDKR